MADDLSDKLVYIDDFDGALASMRLTSEFWKRRPNTPVSSTVSDTAVYVFQTAEDRAVFANILDEHGITYTNKIKEREEPKGPENVSYSQGSFDNAASMVGFIVGYNSLDEVIASDSDELEVIDGSFEAIGDRMSYLISQIEDVLTPKRSEQRAEIYGKHGQDSEDYWKIPRDTRELIDQEVHTLYNEAVLIPGESNIELVNLMRTKGMQFCPFEGCRDGASSTDYVIRNTETGRKLWINPMTAHLAKDHHLLEKGNDYGITAEEFYEHFMPKGK
jgi:hypothetical protein